MGRRLASLSTALVAAGVVACYRTPGLDIGRVPQGVVAETQITYYDISAASLAEIRQAIRSSGPRSDGRRWGAITTWQLSWQSQTRVIGSMCEPRRVDVRVRTTINLPRWNPTAQPDSELLVWWQQYNTGLAQHERGHALLAVQGAGDIARALERTQAPCGLLNTRMRTTFDQLVLALRAKQDEYDFNTRHGATQIQQVRALHDP